MQFSPLLLGNRKILLHLWSGERFVSELGANRRCDVSMVLGPAAM